MGAGNIVRIDRQKVRRVFKEYVSSYNAEDEKIKLKIVHTYKVAEICERISRSLGFSTEDVDLAWLMGMLHDIGRFEQVKQYGTFDDSVSVDHAKFGVKILFDEGMIREFVDDIQYDQLISDAISYHNMFMIPEDITERTKSFSNILRDADKIDILRVQVSSPLEKVYDITTEELYNSEVTKEVVDSFMNAETVLHSLRKTGVDNIIGRAALVFGLNFKESFVITKEQGCLDKMMNFNSENSTTRKQFAVMRDFVNEFMATKTEK